LWNLAINCHEISSSSTSLSPNLDVLKKDLSSLIDSVAAFWLKQINERETFVKVPLQFCPLLASLTRCYLLFSKTVVRRLVWRSCWIIGSCLDSCCCGCWWMLDSLLLVRSVATLCWWRGDFFLSLLMKASHKI
jgi:hypothetical protein